MGQAVMEQNAADGRSRHYILVQIPDEVGPDSPAGRLGFKFLTDLTKERLRRAAQSIRDKSPLLAGDLGYRVLTIDSSNMKDVFYTPDESKQGDLLQQIDNIREDRTPEDPLHGCH